MQFLKAQKWWKIFNRLIIYSMIMTFVCSQAVFAGALNGVTGQAQKTKEELEKEGFIGEEYINQLKGRESFQREKIKEFEELQAAVKMPKKNLLKSLKSAEETSRDLKAINEYQNSRRISEIRSESRKKASLIESFGRKYIKYGDGKKVWMMGGLVTDIENEVIYDRKGNRSLKNTRNMKYNSDYQMISYESFTDDALGNRTDVKWSDAKYWNAQDETKDARKKEGTLASFNEARTDELGVETTTEWEDITYYTESDESQNESHKKDQMASYNKTQWSDATPERIDEIETYDIRYLEREKTIFEKSDDPKDAERRRNKSYYKDILMVDFKEKRTTFDVTTEREWGNAVYNAYNELTYYEESSSTLEVETDKVFDRAEYDSYGRLVTYHERIENYDEITERARTNTTYNDKNQIMSYEEEISNQGVNTVIIRDEIEYNDKNPFSLYSISFLSTTWFNPFSLYSST